AADEAIQEQLLTIYANIEALEHVKVSVRSSVVRLSGKALSAEARNQAGDLATRMSGVLFVDNHISETSEVADRISPTIERIVDFIVKFAVRIPLYAIALVVIVLFWQLARFLVRWEWPFERLTGNEMVRAIIKQIIRAAVFVGGLIIALDLLDATALVGAVVGTAGVMGLAIGFAFKDIVENYLASVILSVRRPFEPHDLVEVDKYRGKVVRMTTRDTVLMTAEGNHVRIPNAVVFKSVLFNFTRNPRRRFDFAVSVGTDEDLLEVQLVGLAALNALEGVLGDPGALARVEELGDSSVTVRFFAWVDQRQTDLGKMRSEAIRLVKLSLEAAEVDMPAPIYRIESLAPGALSAEPRQKSEERTPYQTAKHLAVAVQTVQDVTVDDDIDRQIDEEQRDFPEKDLLLK
nr:mechanosensitive ion channel family protein [Lujinxingiaceae bacterium]